MAILAFHRVLCQIDNDLLESYLVSNHELWQQDLITARYDLEEDVREGIRTVGQRLHVQSCQLVLR